MGERRSNSAGAKTGMAGIRRAQNLSQAFASIFLIVIVIFRSNQSARSSIRIQVRIRKKMNYTFKWTRVFLSVEKDCGCDSACEFGVLPVVSTVLAFRYSPHELNKFSIAAVRAFRSRCFDLRYELRPERPESCFARVILHVYWLREAV